ncbi:hypothetical protein H097_27170 [Pseudomonas sp. FH4]|uniref:hypothetical protein n=1 Tax=Pseudomonas fluorescens group TaxID=136843 RepID=UPI0003DC49FC|nr:MULTISPECIES: hypothetical protein [Pseudomonas fluorescens group]ETK13526.1 hypothetical protein H097_27170 [Pseudomonas sp. FH4]WJM93528.1 hypothetical protein QDY63_11825 [Pseudomonas brenneri]
MAIASGMRRYTELPTLLTAVAILMTANIAVAEPSLWVSNDRVARHTCPSDKCGVVGKLMFREGVEVFETKGSWVRVSKSYSASCSGGTSAYVDNGNSACVESNGIKNGMFAEWVSKKSLTKDRPADPGEGATGDDVLIKNSDDYRLYRSQFAKAARELIEKGACTAADFEEIGGWMASPDKGQGMYFMYCGGMTKANRLYLDVRSGNVSR